MIDAWTSHMMFRGVERIGAAEMIRSIQSAIEAAVEDERQACAAIADNIRKEELGRALWTQFSHLAPEMIRDAILARSGDDKNYMGRK